MSSQSNSIATNCFLRKRLDNSGKLIWRIKFHAPSILGPLSRLNAVFHWKGTHKSEAEIQVVIP